MSKVNRSIYQKEVEKNRKLIRDIKAITEGDMEVFDYYVIKFEEEERERKELQSMIKDWMKENPNDPAVIAVNKLTEDYEKLRKGPGQACKHERRTPYLVEDVIFGLIPCTPPKTICIDCGELITMLSNTVFGKGMDPQAKRNEAHKRHG